MRFSKWIQVSAIWLAVSGMLLPVPCLLGEETKPTQAVPSNRPLDVGLEVGNVLRGFVVDNAGAVAPDVHVLLFHEKQVVAAGLSDETGEFAIANVRGGFYQIAAGERVVSLRCWAPHTAPPTAKASTLIQIEDVQRGQINPGTCALINPWIIAGIAAAAIAIPVALKSNSDDRQNISL